MARQGLPRRWLLCVAGVALPLAMIGAVAAEEPKRLSDILAIKGSLEFPQESLELALNKLAANVSGGGVKLAIQMIGKDLQVEGITKNQTIRDFKQENKTVADILTALLIAANPDRTVVEASDPRLQLIWIIGPDPMDPKREIILITTRNAAKKRGDRLPKTFLPGGEARQTAHSAIRLAAAR